MRGLGVGFLYLITAGSVVIAQDDVADYAIAV
jgi:hypothetical protein